MSVFGFSRTAEVWGLKRSLVMAMIDWWIEEAGPRPYLSKIKMSYDNGYNHADLSEMADVDKAELRDLVRLMLERGYECQAQLDTAQAVPLRESIRALYTLLNEDLKDTPFHSEWIAPTGGI